VVGLIELGERADQAFAFRIIGSDGIIEVNTPDGPPLKILSGFRQQGWYAPELPVTRSSFHSELEELIDAVEGRVVHRSNAKNGRRALEIIIGIFESSARRTALDFPIEVRDFPLERMIREKMI